MPEAPIYVAATSFQCDVDGKRYTFHKDITLIRKGHPALKGHEHYFKPVRVHYDVEQATANPGERRSVGRPPGKR